MGKNFTYVDNSSLYIGGCQLSAVEKGMPLASTIREATMCNTQDRSWQMDYQCLRNLLVGRDPSLVGCAKLWGSTPPDEAFWKMVERKGFEVTTFKRDDFTGQEKGVDVAIVFDVTKDAFSGVIDRDEDEITLVTGDADFVPMVKGLVETGFSVDVAYWGHAAFLLKEAASKFINLDEHFEILTKSRREESAA